MIFADTFYFLALMNENDAAHERAVATAVQINTPLMTTEWVCTEFADGFRLPAQRRRCAEYLAGIRQSPKVKIVVSNGDVWNEGFELFSQRPDKEWSLTDCISFVVMKKHRIKDALTGDHHFEQAGFRALLK